MNPYGKLRSVVVPETELILFLTGNIINLRGNTLNADDVIAFCRSLMNRMQMNLIISHLESELYQLLDNGGGRK